ncbi:hypothetical protein EYF80_016955 [Liparis tanakae]|uniref:Uncharacterized protein n=1 Tax=Liparis tanakae TaxID=230148 RepID=A0A4Z2I6A0_9TELE|nr:hypothetical protein EYF80_016955 [Liparis tanakae]
MGRKPENLQRTPRCPVEYIAGRTCYQYSSIGEKLSPVAAQVSLPLDNGNVSPPRVYRTRAEGCGGDTPGDGPKKTKPNQSCQAWDATITHQ